MNYIEQNLMNGESIVYRGHLHWVIFLVPAFFLIAAISLAAGDSGTALAAILSGIGVILAIIQVINYKNSEYVITNKRIMIKVGFIRRQSLEILLNKVEGIYVNQNITGRILGFGTIQVNGTGGTKEPFKNIVAPLDFRKKAQEQLAIVQDS